MKILFAMYHPGFVRNYEAALRLLAGRGHAIHICYLNDRNKQGEKVHVEELCRSCEGVTHGVAPGREANAWARLAWVVRTFQDYLRYLAPEYAGATRLRERVERTVPGFCLRMAEIAARAGTPWVGLLARLLQVVERAIPRSRTTDAFVRKLRPDVLLVTPLVDVGSEQVDYVRSARAQGIPTALCVASWDNLSNKGLMRVIPDRIFVWNETQKREAMALHGAPAERLVVTGAQLFDHWFGWKPSRSRAEFCQRSGLRPDRPFILYAGSSYFIAPKEGEAVEEWLRELRRAPDPLIAEAGVLIRPHPLNRHTWFGFDPTKYANVALWPDDSEVFGAQSKADYYDSIFHSSAVVGVNTSALIEAGIVGRRVCTIRWRACADGQEGTIHFGYLVDPEEGLLYEARGMEEHIVQLREALVRGDEVDARSRRFVDRFVRPFGRESPGTPLLVDAIERMPTEVRVSRDGTPWWAHLLRVPLFLVGLVVPGPEGRRRPWWVPPLRGAVWVAVHLAAGVLRGRAAGRKVAKALRGA